MTKLPFPKPLSTFSVGSLPHTQLELAIQAAFALDVPTLPQLPVSDAAEYMLPQALEGFPGLSHGPDGRTRVDPDAWARGTRALNDRLDEALLGGRLEPFEPTPATTRAWRPFLWEVEHRRSGFAKAQLAGPMTAVWASTLADGSTLSSRPDIAGQAVRLVVARAMAIARALASTGTRAIICLDEPGLYAFDKRRPSHVAELADLRIALEAVRREGAIAAVHCCGNTDWAAVFGLPVDLVSADTGLSLAAQLATGAALDAYLDRGGTLGLGIIPTHRAERRPVPELVAELLTVLGSRKERVLAGALLSPACGLALRTVAESEATADDLRHSRALLAND